MPVYSWGRGEDGQLGIGETVDEYRPVLVEALEGKNIRQIACGSGHTVVLTEEYDRQSSKSKSVIYSWGRGDDGRLGHGDNGWKYVPKVIEALNRVCVVQITCGSYHTAAVTEGGGLYTWGGGMYGKLGHGNEVGHAVPRRVEYFDAHFVKQVACGSRHTVALLENKDVYTWGDKENGVSGHGEIEGHQYLPRIVEELKGLGVQQVSACGFHTAALSSSGDVYTFGEGKFGRLGNDSEGNQLLATRVEGLAGQRIKQVTCGGFHTAATTVTGLTYTWGGGGKCVETRGAKQLTLIEHGQLGHGDRVNKLVPCLVRDLEDSIVIQVTCGWSHTVCLTDKGETFSFGNGDHGKLGHNDALKVSIPRLIEALEGKRVVSVASYNEHTVALTDPTANGPTSILTSTYSNDMKQLINNNAFSDIKFFVEGRPVHSHRAILAVRSEHFAAMLRSGMRESRECEVLIQNIRLPVFMALMEYIYVDTIDVEPLIAIELYVAADLYTIDRLKGLCEILVQKGIEVGNAAAMLHAADELHSSRLREICMGFIIEHFDLVTKSEGFQLLSRDLILETLQSR